MIRKFEERVMIKNRIAQGFLVAFTLFTLSPLPALAATDPELETSTDETNGVPLEDVQRFSNALSQIKKYYVNKMELRPNS